MANTEQRLREAIRSRIQKLKQENAEADAEWIVDKIATALDAATNKKKDYQYAAATQSGAFKDLAKDIKKRKEANLSEQDEVLRESFFDWLAGGATNLAHGIIDRRAGYLQKAMVNDPKLQRMAREAGLSASAFEKKVYSMMGRDRDYLNSIINQRWR